MSGSNQKCENTGNTEHSVASRDECESEATNNNANYYSYVEAQKQCFYSLTCSNIQSGTGWNWEIYELSSETDQEGKFHAIFQIHKTLQTMMITLNLVMG